LARSEQDRIRLLFASDGENIEQHQSYIRDLEIEEYPYVVSEGLGMYYQVSKLPFAILIDHSGVLRSKGLVNTREHLESLIESMDTGVATVQEYVGSKSDSLKSKTELSAAENMS
jgi:methylamine dehydrogenase accessory protein MauD